MALLGLDDGAVVLELGVFAPEVSEFLGHVGWEGSEGLKRCDEESRKGKGLSRRNNPKNRVKNNKRKENG